MLSKETFLFFLQNSQGQSYFRKANGVIDYTNTPTWTPEAPHGWFEQELAFGRNVRYWGFNRNYTQSFTFYNDAADILRYLHYKKRGIEEIVYLIVLKLDDTTDIYQPYYKGEIDLSHIDDEVVAGVKVNVMQGGLQKLIKAYENTTFEIPCDGSIPENVEVLLQGIMFKAVFNYSVLPFTVRDQAFFIPIVFGTKEGNDMGVIKNDQKYQAYDIARLLDTTYDLGVYKNTNNAFSSVKAVPGMRVIGSWLPSANTTAGHLFVATSLGAKHDLIPVQTLIANTTYTFDVTFDLAAGENMFLCFESTGSTPSFSDTPISFQFNSQFDDTTTFGLRPFDLLNLLLKKIAQAASLPSFPLHYELKSDLLNQYKNLVLTCGMALRQETGAVIKTTVSQFFESFDSLLCASMGVEDVDTGLGERLFFETLAYSLDSTSVSMELGEVAELKISPALDLYFDTIKVGYPEQKYDEKQGNQEYNTTSQFRAPIKRVQKEYKKVSVYRGDSNGIEYTRYLTGNTNTSNNKSDNDVFIINTDFANTVNSSVQIGISGNQSLRGNGFFIPLTQYSTKTGSSFAGNLSFGTIYSPNDSIRYVNNTPANVGLDVSISGIYIGNNVKVIHGLFGFVTGTYRYPVCDAYIQLIKNNAVIYQEQQTLYDGQAFSFHYNINSLNLVFGDSFYINIIPVNPAAPYIMELFEVSINQAKWSINETAGPSVYGLKKVNYASASGVDNIAFAYNIEDMTPARMIQKHFGFIVSVLSNLLGDTLAFLTNDKNKNLVTSVDGINFIAEKDDIPLSSITANPLFYPYYFSFKTQVPEHFAQIQSSAANSQISFTRNGKTFYGFPMQVKQKPALNEAQEWKVLCSPLTNIDDLINLEYTGLNNITI